MQGLEEPARVIAPFAAFVALWALVVWIWHVPTSVMPSPLAVVQAFGDMIAKGILPAYVFETARRIALAGSTGAVLGVLVGFVIGLSEPLSALLSPPLRFFQSLSGIAWLPLLLIWFGFSDRTIVVSVWYTLVFPVTFNTMLGVRMVPRQYRDAIRTLGGDSPRIIFQVLLPGALTHIVSGLRLGIAYGWRALIAAEILVGAGGLGYLIFKAEAFDLTPRIVAGMVTIGVLWYLTDYFVLRPLEEATVERWGLVYR